MKFLLMGKSVSIAKRSPEEQTPLQAQQIRPTSLQKELSLDKISFQFSTSSVFKKKPSLSWLNGYDRAGHGESATGGAQNIWPVTLTGGGMEKGSPFQSINPLPLHYL